MAKDLKKTEASRLNIYLHDPTIRRQVKAAAAKRDLSISEYCLRAITAQLVTDGERSPSRNNGQLEATIRKARRFQDETFGDRVFAISSADLIREARERNNP
jgi:hypothetical protein